MHQLFSNKVTISQKINSKWKYYKSNSKRNAVIRTIIEYWNESVYQQSSKNYKNWIMNNFIFLFSY